MERGCERYKREGPTETVAGRARIAKPRGISVILIGKYNDHRVERESSRGKTEKGETESGRTGGAKGDSDGVACERRLPRICYGPIAIVSPIYEFHCDTATHPFGWLRCLVGLQCIRECVYNVYLLTVCTLSRVRKSERKSGLM